MGPVYYFCNCLLQIYNYFKIKSEKLIANIIFNTETLKIFPLKSEKNQGCQLSLFTFKSLLVGLAHAIISDKQNILGLKREKNIILDNMIFYIGNWRIKA